MAHVDNLRRHFPALRSVTYLNTGTCGPLPDSTVEAMQRSLVWQLEEGRIGEAYYTAMLDTQQRIREQLAHLFHADASDFALTEGTTHGMNIVLWGLRIEPGDEIVVTDVEHQGALLPVFLQKQRRGAVVRPVNGAVRADELCAALERTLTARTRLIVCSHVSYATGHRLPIERIVEIAHRHGVLVAVDGAQGAGAEPLDLPASGVDFYALSGHKWLCGPDGTGALYVRRGLEGVLEPTYAGYATLRDGGAYEWTGHYLPSPGALRFEHGLAGLANWIGWLESLQFLRVQAGWDYVYTRIHGLSGQLIDQLLDIDHVRILTPRDNRVGLVHFQIDNMEPDRFCEEAKSRRIDIRTIAERRCIRVSTGFYNNEDDLVRLVNLVKSAPSL